MKISRKTESPAILTELFFLFGLWGAGEFFYQVLGFFIPGTVSGFLMFFLLLLLKGIRPEKLERSCNFFLKYLGFFFIPPGVALLASVKVIQAQGFKLLLVIFVTTLLIFGVTGLVTQFLIQRQEKRHG